MKSAENIEKLIKNLDLDIDINAETERVILGELSEVHEKSKKMKSALVLPNIRRTIMRSPITKLAVAAVIITAVALGLFEFIGTEGTSGVVWAEVAKKVQASRGVIFRRAGTSSDMSREYRKDEADYSILYNSPRYSRRDDYKGDQIYKTFYDDFNTKTSVFIDHGHKSYIKRTVEGMEQNDLWGNPKSLVQRFLSHEHRELGQKTVEGVLCEGIETTDPAFLGPDPLLDSLMARIWVSVETGYPIQFEVEIIRNNGQIRIAGVADQFQWDVELDESIFEPNIPADYIDIWPGE